MTVRLNFLVVDGSLCSLVCWPDLALPAGCAGSDGQVPAAARPRQPEVWYEPTEPFHIAGPIYYVGTRGLSVFLITTSDGDILLGGAMPGTAPLIEASIRKLGFKPEDIRILLLEPRAFRSRRHGCRLQEADGRKGRSDAS